MAVDAVTRACRELGVEPGAELRSAVDGPPQDDLFEDQEAGRGQWSRGGKAPVWHGRGRKPGAKNRATKDVIDFVRRTGRDPMMYYADVAAMSPQEVARQFGVKFADAWRIQLHCVDRLAERLYPVRTIADAMLDTMGKQADAVAVMGLAQLAGMRPGEAGTAAAEGVAPLGGGALDMPQRTLAPSEQNQGLSGGDDERLA